MVINTVIRTDVLVVGGGMTGIMAAIRAKHLCENVVLVDKAMVSRSGATVFTHGTLAPVPAGEEELWVKELANHATNLCDQKWAEIIVREQRNRIDDMVEWGVPFERKPDGSFVQESGRGQRCSKIVLYDGKKVMQVLRNYALTIGVKIIDRVAVTDLLTSDAQYPTSGEIVGALGLNTRNGEAVVFKSGSVVLTAGMGGIKSHALYVDNLTGDAHAMAYRVGAELAGMEFTTVPTFSIWQRYFCTPSQSQFQSHGSKIVNAAGQRIIEKYYPGKDEQDLDFGTLSRMVIKETMSGEGPVYFDLRQWTDQQITKLTKVQPRTMKAFERAGVKIPEQFLETTPLNIVFSGSGEGGIRIDIDTSTNVPGLFAAGACALNAGNISSLMGIPQAFCSVSGYRAGEAAAKRTVTSKGQNVNRQLTQELYEKRTASLARTIGLSPGEILWEIQKVILPFDNSFFKTHDSISTVIQLIDQIRHEALPQAIASNTHDLLKVAELDSMVELLDLTFSSALERRESRLTHYREDYPYQNDTEWLKWIILKRTNSERKIYHDPCH